MSDNQAACAHLRIKYVRVEENGRCRDTWRCEYGCGAYFWPSLSPAPPVQQAGARLSTERLRELAEDASAEIGAAKVGDDRTIADIIVGVFKNALLAAPSPADEREALFKDFLEQRGVEIPCKKCGGLGVTSYPSTATWRGGVGGQVITLDVCNDCWGSGDANKKWAVWDRTPSPAQPESAGPTHCDECGEHSDAYTGIGIGKRWFCEKCWNALRLKSKSSPAQSIGEQPEFESLLTDLTHTRSCPSLTPLHEEDCTCGLLWRVRLRTEMEQCNAWRKRAMEAEAAEHREAPAGTDAGHSQQTPVREDSRLGDKNSVRVPSVSAADASPAGAEGEKS